MRTITCTEVSNLLIQGQISQIIMQLIKSDAINKYVDSKES